MNVLVAAVGRMKAGPEKALIETYLNRLPWSVDIREVESKGGRGRGSAVAEETTKLLDGVPEGAKIISLDSRGKSLSSEELAAKVQVWRDDGVRSLAFLIGGADGLGNDAFTASDLTLSFGHATWPHMLVRVMLIEQLYRTHCILTDHPYHRGH